MTHAALRRPGIGKEPVQLPPAPPVVLELGDRTPVERRRWSRGACVRCNGAPRAHFRPRAGLLPGRSVLVDGFGAVVGVRVALGEVGGARRRERGRLGGEPEVVEDAARQAGLGDEGDELEPPVTPRAVEHVDGEHAAQVRARCRLLGAKSPW